MLPNIKRFSGATDHKVQLDSGYPITWQSKNEFASSVNVNRGKGSRKTEGQKRDKNKNHDNKSNKNKISRMYRLTTTMVTHLC